MKRALLGTLLAASSLGAGSPFSGKWKGELEGLTAVRLSVAEDHGKISGSITFYLIRKDEKGTRVDGEYTCELLQATGEGKRMTFEVKHHVTHNSPEYGPNVKFQFDLRGEDEGTLLNVSDGMSVPMVSEQ